MLSQQLSYKFQVLQEQEDNGDQVENQWKMIKENLKIWNSKDLTLEAKIKLF